MSIPDKVVTPYSGRFSRRKPFDYPMEPHMKPENDPVTPQATVVEPEVSASENPPQTPVSERAAHAAAARDRASEHLSEKRYDEARTALDEADRFEADTPKWRIERTAAAEAARERAARLLTERRFDEARQALDEAEELDGEPPAWKTETYRIISGLRDRLPKRKKQDPAAQTVAEGAPAGEAAADPAAPAEAPLSPAAAKAQELTRFYSKIAAGIGLLPGGVLNFAGVLAVDVTMVWKIANEFGHTEGKERIRGSILSMAGAVVPSAVGHTAGAAISAIPAVIAGTVVYYVAAPALAYAMTQAIGNAYIMHFEGGGTLLSFDAGTFRDYFRK